MPNYAQPAEQWLGNRLGGMQRDSNGLKAQTTQFLVNSEGVTTTIIGNVEYAPGSMGALEKTGLSGVGIAVFAGGEWVKVSGGTATSVAMAYRNAAQSIKENKDERVKLDKAIKEGKAGLWELTNGYYIVPAEGYYQVSGQVGGNFVEKKVYIAQIYVNEVNVLEGSRSIAAASLHPASVVTGVIFCKANDHIELWCYNEGAEAALDVGSANSCRLSVSRVGEGPEGKEGKAGAAGEKGEKGEKGEGTTLTGKAPIKVTGTEIELLETLAGEGLEEVASKLKIKAGGITNAMIKAAAGIEDSKLALTTVVKLAGEQTITGEKKFTGNASVTPQFSVGRLIYTAAPAKVIPAPGPSTISLGNFAYLPVKTLEAEEENTILRKVNKTGEIPSPVAGQVMVLENANPIGRGNVTVEHHAPETEEGEVGLFMLSTGASFVLEPGHTMTFIYSGALARWRDVAYR